MDKSIETADLWLPGAGVRKEWRVTDSGMGFEGDGNVLK